MCEVLKGQRRTYRDQDPPRIRDKSTENLLKDDFEMSRSTPNSPTTTQHRATSLEKCFSDPEFFRKQRLLLQRKREGDVFHSNSAAETTATGSRDRDSTSSSREYHACSEPDAESARSEFCREPIAKVPPTCGNKEVCVWRTRETSGLLFTPLLERRTSTCTEQLCTANVSSNFKSRCIW